MSAPAILLNEGMNDLASDIINAAGGGPTLVLRLYVYSGTVSSTTTLADLIAGTDSGLADQALSSGSWTSSAAGGISSNFYPPITFTAVGGSGQTYYGSVLYDSSRMVGLWAQPFPTPLASPGPGATVVITPSYQLGNV